MVPARQAGRQLGRRKRKRERRRRRKRKGGGGGGSGSGSVSRWQWPLPWPRIDLVKVEGRGGWLKANHKMANGVSTGRIGSMSRQWLCLYCPNGCVLLPSSSSACVCVIQSE